MTLSSEWSPIFPLVVHHPTSPSIWPAGQSLRRGLSINPDVCIWRMFDFMSVVVSVGMFVV